MWNRSISPSMLPSSLSPQVSFRGGFDVSPDAPETYKGLKAHLDAGKRLVVYDGGCEATIYADPAVNHAFRAWHDWTHWAGDYDFSLQGECCVFDRQRRHLLYVHGDTEQVRRWVAILRAEVIGQRVYYERHKRYVEDQRGFIEAYLKNPEDALLWPL